MHFNGITGRCDTPERAKCMPACEHSSGVFPFPGRCGMYYRCDDYVATVLSCIKGLHFNARTLVCDWPESAHCELECPKLSGYYPIQATCSSYLKCDHGRPKLVTCADGEHFNYETKRCGTPENANCQPSCINGDGMFPVPGHCDSYIRCHDRKPYITTCPDGLLFNRVLGVCDLAENVFC
ncbi:protein obstructor-E [Anabrus simplex]|uniref:protein obstructor-E n=1 Tax=Anabrus simplex TaxID=316456 RepID=UPI0035A3CAB4